MIAAVILLLLVGANAVFVAAEFSLVGVRPTRIQQLADAGQRWAARVAEVLHDAPAQDRFFATSQLGITVASLGLGMYGEHALADQIVPWLAGVPLARLYAHALATAAAVVILTYLHVVLGEMVPKSLALANPEATARRVGVWVAYLGQVVAPVVKVLNRLGAVVLGLLRISPAGGKERVLSAEELAMVIDESAEGGLLQSHEGQIMASIFDFAERTVNQVMTPRTRMEAFPVDIEEEALVRALTGSRHTRFPVYRGDADHIVGILHVKEFVRWRLDAKRGHLDLAALVRTARMVPEQMPLDQMLEIFKETRAHMAIVIDEYGGTAGLVTLEDLVEEVVGEVRDEFDDELPPVLVHGTDLFVVQGDVQLEDLESDYDVAFPEDRPEVDTVGGLVVTLLGRPAEVGDRVELGEYALTVEEIRGLAVSTVRIERVGGDEDADGGQDASVEDLD